MTLRKNIAFDSFYFLKLQKLATKPKKMSEQKVSQNPLNIKRINRNHFQNVIFGCITVKMKFQRTQELRQLLVSQIKLIRCFTEIF